MKIENSSTQMRKGLLDYCVLTLLSKDDLYASDIIKKLKESELIVVEGTLYPLLNKLKNGDLLNYRWEESTQGPPRKYYRLTQHGIDFLNDLDKSWEELIATVENIKKSPAKLKLNSFENGIEENHENNFKELSQNND